MGWITGIAIYFVIWWMTFFMVLPFGVKAQGDSSQGHEAGAPERPMVWIKMAINTVLAGVVWLIIYLINAYDLITIRPAGM